MSGRHILEISVQSVEAAVAVERGGAQRIELCAALETGGLTPSKKLTAAVRSQVAVPIFSMIRVRAGNFVYSEAEVRVMRRQIEQAKALGMDGVVLGALTRDGRVDVRRTQELVEAARPLRVTFHRAFDECRDLPRALENLIEAGATRVLTSGGAATALAGAQALARLVAAAGGRITIMAGSGINANNIKVVAKVTGAREVHSGLGSVMAYSNQDYALFAEEVRRLRRQLDILEK